MSQKGFAVLLFCFFAVVYLCLSIIQYEEIVLCLTVVEY